MKGYLRERDQRALKPGAKRSRMACTKWQLVVEFERGADGKRNQQYRSFSGSREQAQAALREFLNERESGVGNDGNKLSVQAFLEKWLKHTETRVRATTAARYRQLLTNCVISRVGSKKLREFRAIHVQELYDAALSTGNTKAKKKGGPLSARTVVQLHNVLFAAMKQARKWGLIATNPCESVDPPRPVHHEMRSLSGGEARGLISSAQGTRLYVPIVLTLAVGFRRGEVLALGWEAIDFERSTARVSRSLQDDGSFSEPKTARSRRIVGLPAIALAALRAHKAAQNQERLAAGAAYRDQGLVFADALGDPWKPSSISTLFHSICKRADLGHVRFHDLRHSAASLLIERGVPVTTVAAMLGHANTSTTLSVYAHAIKGAEQVAAAAMDGILKGIESSA